MPLRPAHIHVDRHICSSTPKHVKKKFGGKYALHLKSKKQVKKERAARLRLVANMKPKSPQRRLPPPSIIPVKKAILKDRVTDLQRNPRRSSPK